MSGFQTGKYSTFEEAFEGGRRYEIELSKQGKDEQGDASEGGLTVEQVEAMSQEEHIARKDEVDAFLQEQGK